MISKADNSNLAWAQRSRDRRQRGAAGGAVKGANRQPPLDLPTTIAGIDRDLAEGSVRAGDRWLDRPRL
jgi:hypothetical protein